MTQQKKRRQVPSKFSNICASIESEVRDHLESWKAPFGERRQWDSITIKFVDDPDVSATVDRFSNDVHEIKIGRELIRSIVGLVERSWGTGKGVSEENKSWKVATLSKYSVLLVYYHEFAHVVRGHLFELASRTKKVSARFSWDETRSTALKGNIRRCRWMERDADVIGADYFAMYTVLPYWKEKDLEARKTMARFCLTSAAAICVQIELDRRKQKTQSTIHDAPYLRWLTYVEALGGALVRELELDDEDLFSMVGAILEELQAVAKQQKLPPDLWALADLDRFKTENRRHRRIVDSYLRYQEKYLENRSSFLPDVGPQFATTEKAVTSTISKLENLRS